MYWDNYELIVVKGKEGVRKVIFNNLFIPSKGIEYRQNVNHFS